MEDDQSAKFIQRMFSHAARDRIAILAVPRSAGNAEQRVFTLPQATSRKVQAWLRHLNARDYDIYLCVNPIRPGSRGREKADIAEVRRLQLDLDEDGPTGYARVLEDLERGALPRPAHILRSSKDRYQFLWDTVPDRWSHEQAEAVMRGLAERYGGDRAATDVARVMRLPGFRNCKPGRARSLITWTWYGGRMVRPEDFGGLALPEREPASRAEGRRRIPPGTTPRASGTGPRRAMRCGRARRPRLSSHALSNRGRTSRIPAITPAGPSSARRRNSKGVIRMIRERVVDRERIVTVDTEEESAQAIARGDVTVEAPAEIVEAKDPLEIGCAAARSQGEEGSRNRHPSPAVPVKRSRSTNVPSSGQYSLRAPVETCHA